VSELRLRTCEQCGNPVTSADEFVCDDCGGVDSVYVPRRWAEELQAGRITPRGYLLRHIVADRMNRTGRCVLRLGELADLLDVPIGDAGVRLLRRELRGLAPDFAVDVIHRGPYPVHYAIRVGAPDLREWL
jgi:hypothetical protein